MRCWFLRKWNCQHRAECWQRLLCVHAHTGGYREGLRMLREASPCTEAALRWCHCVCVKGDPTLQKAQAAGAERMRCTIHPHTLSDSETECTEPSPRTGCNVARVNIERPVSTMEKAKAKRRMAAWNSHQSLSLPLSLSPTHTLKKNYLVLPHSLPPFFSFPFFSPFPGKKEKCKSRQKDL